MFRITKKGKYKEIAVAAEDDDVRIADLVVEEFAEVANVHTALAGIDDGNLAADDGAGNAGHRLRNVGKLADAGRLDEDAVGSIVLDDLIERLGEVADEGAADAAGIHFGYLDACVLEEAAVNGDLAEFVLDEDELFVFVALCNELADERGLAGT